MVEGYFFVQSIPIIPVKRGERPCFELSAMKANFIPTQWRI